MVLIATCAMFSASLGGLQMCCHGGIGSRPVCVDLRATQAPVASDVCPGVCSADDNVSTVVTTQLAVPAEWWLSQLEILRA